MNKSETSEETLAQQFYLLRNDRMVKCMAGLLPKEIHCAVKIDDQWSLLLETEPALETLCNLLARFCRHITIVIPLPQRIIIDVEKLLSLMKAADPHGNFALSSELPKADLQIVLGGNASVLFSGSTIHWGFVGWRAFVAPTSQRDIIPKPGNIDSRAGAELAACLAGAAAFRFWHDGSLDTVNAFAMDLMTMSEITSESASQVVVEVEPKQLNVLMVGAGSVGSSSAYFLPRLGFCGKADVVDHDIAKIENMDRSPVFFVTDAQNKKSEIVATYLQSCGLVSTPYPITWDQFIAQNPDSLRSYDVWLPLANEFGVRRSMQANYPPTCFQASTGLNWNVSYGRHIPFVDDCQMDRFPTEAAGPLKCGGGEIVTKTGDKVDAAFPFCSFVAGLFVAAAVLRKAMGTEDAAPNAASLFFKPKFNIWSSDRKAMVNCICQSMNRAIWDEIWTQETSGLDTLNVATPPTV